MAARILEQPFYARGPKIVARQLLGKLLVSTLGGKRASGIIVETESYLSTADSACHGHRGKTRGNSTMFGPAGIAYVYPIHAKYCFNTVTESKDRPSAVLIRAIQPVEGIRIMRQRRRQSALLNLCSGPAKLCQALNLCDGIDGIDLTRHRFVWIEKPVMKHRCAIDIRQTTRIGVTSAQDLKLRFVFRNHPFASGPRYLR